MQQPTDTLQSYSGGTLNIIGQMTVTLAKGDGQLQTVVYIQDVAPVDLLLGTDLPYLLGFCLQEPRSDGPHRNLLDDGAVEEKQNLGGGIARETGTSQLNTTSDQTSIDSPRSPAVYGTVRLLCTTRVPPHHFKLAMVSVEETDQCLLLKPLEFLLSDKGILVEAGVAQSDKVGRFALVLHIQTRLFGGGKNYWMHPDCPDCAE